MPETKPGWRSTEFWLSVAAFAVGVFLLSGALPSDHWSVKLGGALAVGLAALGYSFSRGATKGGAGVLLPLALALVVASAGCGASWQQTTKTSLDAASAAAEVAHVSIRGHYDRRCEERARECAAAKLPDCPSLKTCQDERHKGVAVLSGVQTACMLGYSAIAIADKPTALAKALEAAKAVAELLAALKTQGVMP